MRTQPFSSMRRLACAALCMIAAAGTALPRPGLAAEAVGDVTLVRVWAYATPPGGERDPIFVRDEVLFGALLETVRDGALHARLLDDSEIRLGSNARLEIDELVFDPAAGEEALSLELAAGPMRFISGRIRSERIRIDSRIAEVGIRGTDVFALAALAGEFYLAVLTGIAVLKAKVSGATETLNAGEAAVVSADGTTITRVSRRAIPDELGETPGDTGFPTTDPDGSDGGDPGDAGGDAGDAGDSGDVGDSGKDSGGSGSNGTPDSGDAGSGDIGSPSDAL